MIPEDVLNDIGRLRKDTLDYIVADNKKIKRKWFIAGFMLGVLLVSAYVLASNVASSIPTGSLIGFAAGVLTVFIVGFVGFAIAAAVSEP